MTVPQYFSLMTATDQVDAATELIFMTQTSRCKKTGEAERLENRASDRTWRRVRLVVDVVPVHKIWRAAPSVGCLMILQYIFIYV